MTALLIVAFVVAIVFVALAATKYTYRQRHPDAGLDPNRPKRLGLVALAVAILLGGFLVADANADDGDGDGNEEATTTTVPPEPDQALIECPDFGDNQDFYEVQAVDFGHEDDNTARLNTASGEVSLIGNGPPLDADSDGAAAEALFARTAENPKLTAELAYAFRLEGFTPDQEELEAVNAAPAAFIHQLTANLMADEELWSQTRANLCLEMAYSVIVPEWKDRDVVQFAARPHTFTVAVGNEDVELPVRSVVLKRDPRPQGLNLLWMRAYNGDSVSQRIDVAVDMQFAWVTTFGEVPEDLEEFPQSTTTSTTEGNTGQDDTASDGGDSGDRGGDTGGGSGGDSGGDNGGHGGGDGGGCGGSGCGTGGGDSGGDGGSGCGNGCPGDGGGGDGDDGCVSCPTPTNPPPPTTATTQPPTTQPPTTSPPTTATPTTQPPPPTTAPKPPPPTSTPSTVCNDPDLPGCG